MIEVEELRKEYGELVAVDGVTFTAAEGGVFGLLGPNGAGKTTTISCISGLQQPTAGRVRVMGHDVVFAGPASRAHLGVVPQELALYEELSATENLRYWASAYGLRGAALKQRITESLEVTGLLDRAKEPVKQFSGGMKRRLNFACGIVHEPRVLLLDEPTVGVDPQSRVRLLELVKAQAAAGTCVLYTTHYMEEAETLCDRLAIVDHGKLIAQGTLDELRAMLGERDLLRLSGRFPSEAQIVAALSGQPGAELVQADEESLIVAASAGRPRAAGAPGGARPGRRRDPRDHHDPAQSRDPVHQADRQGAARVAMRYVWATAAKDLRRRLRDPLALVLWLGVPFAILALISLAFGGGDVAPQARLLVADEDDSLVSGLLAGALGQGQMAELVQVEKVSPEEGRRRIAEGDGSALLLIPAEFGSAVLNSRPSRLTLLTNPSQSILPGILEEVLSLLVDAVFYLQRLAGEPLAAFADGPPGGGGTFPDQLIAATSVEINQLVGGLTEYIFPPRLDVTVKVEEPEGQKPANLGALFFQSMLFLAILFIAQGMSDDLWVEKRQGTLHRALTTPHGVTLLLTGKLLAAFLVLLTISILSVSAGAALYGFGAAHVLPAALWAAASGMALLVLFSLLQLFATSQKAGGLLSTLVLFPLMMIGGSFFPLEAMPGWLATIGRRLPNGWALEQFKTILGGGATLASMLPAVVGLLAALAVGIWLSGRRLRGGFLAR